MNTILLEQIRTQILSAVSTTNVYYYHLPSDDYLQQLTITYELNNTSNTGTFEDKEAIKEYRLQININAPALSYFVENPENIKSKIYNLGSINSKVKAVSLQDEDAFYDEDLNIFTTSLNFSLQYS